jgi:serine/threonine protein kinase
VSGFQLYEIEAFQFVSFLGSGKEKHSNKLMPGSFGEVHLASLGNLKVAVKFLKKVKENAAEKLKRELQLLSAIGVSPRRVGVEGLLLGKNTALILEFCEYGSLLSLLHKVTSCSCLSILTQKIDLASHKNCLRWLHQASEALLELHSLDPPVVHRDVNSSNFLVAPLPSIC